MSAAPWWVEPSHLRPAACVVFPAMVAAAPQCCCRCRCSSSCRASTKQPKLQLLLAGLCSASRMCVPRLKPKRKRKKKCVFRRRLDQNGDCALLSANAPPKNNSVSSFHAAFLRLPHPEFPRTQPLQFPSAQTASIKAASMSHKAHVFVCVQADGRK